MQQSLLKLLFLAALPVAASFAILAIAAAGWILWLIQILASCSALAIALAGTRLSQSARSQHTLIVTTIITVLLSLAATLWTDVSGPARWISLGPLNLYMAPVVLPGFLVTISVASGSDFLRRPTFAAVVMTGALLAIQPDASQSIAFLAAVSVVIVKASSDRIASVITLTVLSLATVWSLSQPDPLEPVPHVEGVFQLALEHSFFTGALVIGCAIAFIISLIICALKGLPWLSAVAVYYALLFVCSVAGLTPAPLIGYGAGPLLGFGFMLALSSWAGANRLSDKALAST